MDRTTLTRNVVPLEKAGYLRVARSAGRRAGPGRPLDARGRADDRRRVLALGGGAGSGSAPPSARSGSYPCARSSPRWSPSRTLTRRTRRGEQGAPRPQIHARVPWHDACAGSCEQVQDAPFSMVVTGTEVAVTATEVESDRHRGGSYRHRGGSYRHRGGSYRRRGGSYRHRGGSHRLRGGSYPHRGGSCRLRGGSYRHRGGSYRHRGGSDRHRGGSDRHRGGSDRHRGGSDRHRGGSDRHRGGSDPPPEEAVTPTEVEVTAPEVEVTPTEVEVTATEVEVTVTDRESYRHRGGSDRHRGWQLHPTEVAATPTEVAVTPTEVEATPTEVAVTATEEPVTVGGGGRGAQLCYPLDGQRRIACSRAMGPGGHPMAPAWGSIPAPPALARLGSRCRGGPRLAGQRQREPRERGRGDEALRRREGCARPRRHGGGVREARGEPEARPVPGDALLLEPVRGQARARREGVGAPARARRHAPGDRFAPRTGEGEPRRDHAPHRVRRRDRARRPGAEGSRHPLRRHAGRRRFEPRRSHPGRGRDAPHRAARAQPRRRREDGGGVVGRIGAGRPRDRSGADEDPLHGGRRHRCRRPRRGGCGHRARFRGQVEVRRQRRGLHGIALQQRRGGPPGPRPSRWATAVRRSSRSGRRRWERAWSSGSPRPGNRAASCLDRAPRSGSRPASSA